MKKLLTLSLALVLVMSLCATAFAASSTNPTTLRSMTTDSSDVTLIGSTVDPVYNVIVEFGALEYELTMVWNPETLADGDPDTDGNQPVTGHTYTATLEPVPDSNTITITNHSNVKVNAAYSFLQKNTVAGVTIGMDTIAASTLESAAVFTGAYGNYGVADSTTVHPTFNIALATGYVSGDDILTEDATTFGTITVTLSDAGF